MDILFNQKTGCPLMMQSTNAFVENVGGESAAAKQRKMATEVQPEDLNEKYNIGSLEDKYTIEPWGINNDFPQWANKIITDTSILNTGLKFLRNLTIGQGIYACYVDSYDENGNEILKPFKDARVKEFISSRVVRRCLEKTVRDIFKFGSAATALIPAINGQNFAGITSVNAFKYRYTKRNSKGEQHCVVSGYWPFTPNDPSEYKIYRVLDEYDPELDADLIRQRGGLKQPLIYPIRDSWSNNDVYSEPIWLSAYKNGWVDISHKIPKFLQKAYENQITWKWHIQIPLSYWDQKFPQSDFKTPQERSNAIQKYMDIVEKNLTGTENAEKPLFTNYAINERNGKLEEEWKITALDNKFTGGENLVTSAAANSEILFALMINPNVMGAGMPGGTYAGNQGGSNIREGFLVNIANAWIDRQNILDPLELYIKMMGVKNCQLRFRNTILVTLDHGSGTKKVLS